MFTLVVHVLVLVAEKWTRRVWVKRAAMANLLLQHRGVLDGRQKQACVVDVGGMRPEGRRDLVDGSYYQ
jgi:hypothetical protein